VRKYLQLEPGFISVNTQNHPHMSLSNDSGEG